MPKFLGAHFSISGGFEMAVYHGKKLGCTAIQIFTKNTNQWHAKPITKSQREAFQKAKEETGVAVLLAHAAYLINIASPNPKTWEMSVQALESEVKRASWLEIPYLVLHPGSHINTSLEEGIARIAKAINDVHCRQKSPYPTILLECMAGQGSAIGAAFEELAWILWEIRDKSRIGICLDTCHLFAAGYDIRTPEKFSLVLQEFERLVGLHWVKAFHLNDSKKELGSNVDRHEHIGKGCIGVDAFAYLLNEPRFAEIPMILETPKGEDDQFDVMNLETLRRLINASEN
jgi:deoxyribonuclease-4